MALVEQSVFEVVNKPELQELPLSVKQIEKVKLDNDFEILAYLSGQLRRHYIKIWPGDRVKVELSPYDLSRGRITYRFFLQDLHQKAVC